MNICTCCNQSFESSADLKRHRTQKMNYSLKKYTQYLYNYSTSNEICDCICCNVFFNGSQMDGTQIPHEHCQLRIFVSNQLDSLNIILEGNDVNMDLLMLPYQFKENPILLDEFINFVKDL